MTDALMAVVLAGGRGTRMAPFSALMPKPMLPVLDTPVIVHQLQAVAALGIRQVIVVVGHLGDALRAALGDGARWGVQLRYVEQAEPLGIAHALAQAAPLVDRPFVLTLGDIFFTTQGVAGLAPLVAAYDHGRLDAVLAAKQEPDLAALRRNFSIETNDAGLVCRVVEKPEQPQSTLKGCGVYLFNPTIFQAIAQTPRSALRGEFELTDAIGRFIDAGHRVGVAEVIETDVNLTVARDVWLANQQALRRTGRDNAISPSADVELALQIEQSVVGAHAWVAPGVRVVRSVVFAGARVESDACDELVTTEGRVGVMP